jgi:hypothetical protein
MWQCSAASALFITSTRLGPCSAAEPVPLVRCLYPTSAYYLHVQIALACPSCSKTSAITVANNWCLTRPHARSRAGNCQNDL